MTVPAVNDDPENRGRPRDAQAVWHQDDLSSAWRRQAACREREAHWFFPEGDWRTSLNQVDAAKAICVTCRVRRQCLEFAYRTGKHSGIWGGLTESERRELAAELAPQP